MRLGVQPDGAALRRVLIGVLQKVGNHALDLGRIEWKEPQFVVSQEIQGESALLKTGGPEPANFRKASVHVAFDELHAQFAGFEHTERQEVLNEVLQTLSAGKHIVHHFALARIERSEFLTLEKFDVAVQDREWSLEIVGGGSQSVGGLAGTIAQLFELAGDVIPRAGGGNLGRGSSFGQFVAGTRASGGGDWAFFGHRSHVIPK